MAKISIVGDAVVITSSKKLEDIALLGEYNPKALSLYEEDADGMKVEVFKVGYAATTGRGSIGKYGASFASFAHDGTELATITELLPEFYCVADADELKDYVADKYGYDVVKLNRVEAQIDAALEAVRAERAAIIQNITVA